LLDIEGTFVYSRGVVRLYPKRQTEHARRKTSGKNAWRVDSDIARSGDIVNMATIIIPGLSVWLTYHMPFGSLVATSQRSVHVEVLIHESENVLHPSLVQFLHEIIVGLKFGMQQSSEQKATQMTAAPNLGMNASLYLRLSKTKLDLTCQPYHKVVCSLNWEEGNFLMNSFSDDKASRTLSCVGSVLGASLNLRHHFSPEDCLSASVRDIMFNAMLTSRRAEVNEDNICVIVNVPCITAGLNIRHLQDLLVLKTLWLDQDNASSKPMEQPRNTQSSMEAATTVAVAHAGSKPAPFSHYFALRAQAIDLSVDLGQAIGKVSLESQNILLTTKRIPSLSKVATLTMETIQLKSEGRLVGDARLESIRLFGYFDKLPHSLKPPQGQFCLLTKQSSAAFSYEYQNILHLIIDPISLQSGVNISSERNGGTVTTVSLNKALIQLSVKSIPVVITMYKKLDDLLDKKWAEAGLRRNQPTNKAAGLPATAVLQGVEKSTPLPSDARGEIDMNIEGIEVIIFPNLFSDTDCVQINANRIHAHLFRMMEETHTRRELQLHIADAALLKNVPGKSRERQASSNSNASAARPQMHSSVAIFGIPRTDLTMDSTQILQVLQHVFKVDFDGQINVSLNIGLIKYLQELVHQFEDQYKRALRGPTVPVESTSTATIGDKQSDDQKEETTIKEEIVDDHITLNDLEPKPKPPMKDALEYQALIPVNFQPQLQIMGEATPPVEWLGLRRDRFPAIIHEELTLNLEKILLFGWKLYQEQLEDMTFK
jgi:hypothetical protein